MSLMTLYFSPSGRVPPRPFALAVVALYGASLVSCLLLTAPVTAMAGALVFLLAQAIVTWAWLALHAKRLRDAARPIGLALAIAALYALAVILFLLVIVLIVAGGTGSTIDVVTVVRSIGAMLADPHLGATGYVIVAFLALGIIPVLIAVFFSRWVARQPSAAAAP
jgi:uncharacterized membrane protein YhaH (DUF805 family)